MNIVNAGTFEECHTLAIRRRHPRVEHPAEVGVIEVADGFSVEIPDMSKLGNIGFLYYGGKEPELYKNEFRNYYVVLRAPSVTWHIFNYEFLQLDGWELVRPSKGRGRYARHGRELQDGFALFNLQFQAYICRHEKEDK